jgi:class 3 adenylate cyclase/tetratricopeptide (TPR) repeat protein
MQCSACSHRNPAGARFCNGCGAALDLACSACGQRNPAGSRFCNGCAAPLGAPPSPPDAARDRAGTEHLSWESDPRSYTPRHLAERILTQKSAIEGERKHVTVLFADVADSTALAEEIGDPEAVHALLDRAFQRILGQVHGYEGTVNQFTGDGVMALFGAPIALEDAPRRAGLAALGIQRALEPIDREVRERWGRPFQMRIGIHTGPVVVGAIGDDLRMDYTAIGDTTNLASRLESLAPAGGIVISDATRRLVEGFFDLTPLREATLKGISRPVQTHQLLAARAATTRVDALTESGGGLTDYVGRERDLDVLLSAFEQAAAGHGQVAFVVGEAGIGKSRLLHELRSRLAGRPHLWLEGRCASYAQSTPFYAVADAMRRIHGIDDRDDEAAALAKLAALESVVGDAVDWTLPYLRVLLSLPSGSEQVDALDAMSRRAEMSHALHARIFRIADDVPVVLVLEDMHWVDTATDEFLTYVAESVPAARVLMILTHRPGYEHNLGDRSYHVRVPLRPLSEHDMSQMVGSVLATNDLPTPVRQLIAEKAEGNPLFVEEVTTSLLEEGVLALEGGRAVLTRDLADVSIPDRIQDVLMARLDRLPEEPRRAIQIASVIGREFALRLLSRIHEATQGLDEIVNELRSLELIYEKAAHPELAYMFKHALTHEVAYESLLLGRRKALHRIVGTAIEELYPDRLAEHYEALAHHFGASEDHERALRYHELASEKSKATYANHAAIDHCRKGIAEAERLGNVDPARIQALQARLGVCCWLTSDFGASAEAFLRAAELTTNRAEASLLMARASFSYLWDHDYTTCQSTTTRAFDLASESGEGGAAGEAFAIATRDELELVHGRTIEDDSELERALVLAERSGNDSVTVTVLGQLAQRAEWRSDYRRAIELAARAVALSDRDRSPGSSMFAAWFLGIASVCVGDYARGLEVLGNGLALCDRVGDRAIQARLLNTLGWAYAEFGCHDQAAEFNRSGTLLAREAVDLGLIAGAPELYANSAINLAGNLIAFQRLDDAAEQLAPIQQQYDDDPDPWMRWRWSVHLLHQQARLALARGEPEQALALSRREVEAAQRAASQRLVCRARELCGRIHLAMDAREEAARELAAAADIASRIEHPSVTWRACSLRAELARRKGELAEHERELAVAQQLIEHLAPGVPAGAARSDFLRLGAGLVEDPLGAYR